MAGHPPATGWEGWCLSCVSEPGRAGARRGRQARLADGSDRRRRAAGKKRFRVRNAPARFDATNVLVTQGSWDMRVHQGDPLSVLNWVEWSPQFRKLLGYQTEVEFPASVESWVSRLHPEDKARALSSIRDLQSGEITSNVEYRLRCADEHFRLFSRHPCGEALDRRRSAAGGRNLDGDGSWGVTGPVRFVRSRVRGLESQDCLGRGSQQGRETGARRGMRQHDPYVTVDL